MGSRIEATRPMRSLLQGLPRLPVKSSGDIDFAAADPALLPELGDDAQTTVDVIHLGVGAIGHLLAQSAVLIEDGTVGADSLEAIGFLLAEMGDMAVGCMALVAQCRRETAGAKPSQAVKQRKAAQAAIKTTPGCAACKLAAAHSHQ